LWIDAEAFTYQGKNDVDQQFLNVTRSARGTAAAAHTTADTVYWLQHDIWIFYDDATLAAPTTDDDYKPVMELDTSTNDSWVYQEFGEDNVSRAGGWIYTEVTDASSLLRQVTGNQGTAATPWTEVGLYFDEGGGGGDDAHGRFYLYNLCGITNCNFTNGEKLCEAGAFTPKGYVKSSIDNVTWTTEYTIPALAVGGAGVWEAWTYNAAITAGSFYLALVWDGDGVQSSQFGVEAADCTVTLDSTYTPDCTIGAEQDNYPLACTIANAETGDSIQLALTMSLLDVLEVDTDNKTITNLTEGSNVYGALTMVGGVRRDWLPLINGTNTLTYTETGVTDVDIDIVWDRRYYE